jgi:hypothetical protein
LFISCWEVKSNIQRIVNINVNGWKIKKYIPIGGAESLSLGELRYHKERSVGEVRQLMSTKFMIGRHVPCLHYMKGSSKEDGYLNPISREERKCGRSVEVV